MRMYLKDLEIRNKGLTEDRYPKIEAIKFEMNYIDPDLLTAPHSKNYIRYPSQSAYFFFDCPYYECVDGGHDLTSIVEKMNDECIKEQTGRLVCQGWQDKNRINKNRCLCELNYKIIIDYHE